MYHVYLEDQNDIVFVSKALLKIDFFTLLASFDNEKDAGNYLLSFYQQEPIGSEY